MAPEPPKPPPPPIAEAPKAVPAGPAPRKAIVAPTAVPTEAPPESDKPPPPRSAEDEYADGKGGVVGGVAGGPGRAPWLSRPRLRPLHRRLRLRPPAAAARSGADCAPGERHSAGGHLHACAAGPAAAKADGISATVVVRFVVSETGEVTNVTIVRGHPLFDAGVLATVRSWRYQPAVFEGRPVAVFKTVRFPFVTKM